MSCVAVFVDAGYLFAQGSAALTGAKKPRANITLDIEQAVAALRQVANAKTGALPLLRIYWYDGVRANYGLSADHTALANTDYVKLRLGFVNRTGEQKGVDSLIVADLIELARNRAMTDAVLLSGDEDVRVGVQIAQNFGIRVHLLGIVPARGSQSPQLMQEADTTTEWDAGTITQILSVMGESAANTTAPPVAPGHGGGPGDRQTPDLTQAVTAFAERLNEHDRQTLCAHWVNATDMPRDFDGRLLASCRAAFGRDLDQDEKRAARKAFRAHVAGGQPDPT